MRVRIRPVTPVVLLLGALLLACAGPRPPQLGVEKARLSPCPATPNCVSSDAGDPGHAVAALALAAPAPAAWRAARDAVAALPRTRIVSESQGYLHAECRSALFRFVDDLELHLRADTGHIAVRSAARLGRSDFGVNRRRIEDLRALLRAQGVVR